MQTLCFSHRLSMVLDLQSLFGLLCTAVLIGRDTATPPFPLHMGSYNRALLVSKDRRHLFVTNPLASVYRGVTPSKMGKERVRKIIDKSGNFVKKKLRKAQNLAFGDIGPILV